MFMQKPFSIILAALILGISMQIGIATHFCGGELAQTRMVYGYGAASCGMNCNVPSDDHQETSFQKLSCCQDFIFTIAVDDYQSVSQKIMNDVYQHVFPGVKNISAPDFFVLQTTHNRILPPCATEVSLPFIQVFLI